MADTPLRKLARMVGGVALMQGRLGHQVLGQLLILDSSELEVAGADVVVTATSGQMNYATQVALRSVVPALAVHLLTRKEERRLERLAALTRRRERDSDLRAAGIRQQAADLDAEAVAWAARDHERTLALATATEKIATLESQNRDLQQELLLRPVSPVTPAAVSVPVPASPPEAGPTIAPVPVSDPGAGSAVVLPLISHAETTVPVAVPSRRKGTPQPSPTIPAPKVGPGIPDKAPEAAPAKPDTANIAAPPSPAATAPIPVAPSPPAVDPLSPPPEAPSGIPVPPPSNTKGSPRSKGKKK